MNEPVKLWIRSIALHTYWNIAREPDTFYSVDTEQDADTIVALKLGVREAPPVKAVRAPTPEPPTPPNLSRASRAASRADEVWRLHHERHR